MKIIFVLFCSLFILTSCNSTILGNPNAKNEQFNEQKQNKNCLLKGYAGKKFFNSSFAGIAIYSNCENK